MSDDLRERLTNLLDIAQSELEHGNLSMMQPDDVYTYARALRAFTRAQVRAQQVVKEVQTPELA